MNAPLAGRRVLVTRAAHQAGKLSDGLRALGAEPVEVPVLEIRPPLDLASLDCALRRLAAATTVPSSGTRALGPSATSPCPSATDPCPGATAPCPILSAFSAERVGEHDANLPPDQPAYDWLIFTSVNAVRALVERSAALGLSFGKSAAPLTAAVGEATAKAARDAGFTVALVPENYVAESLIEAFLKNAQPVSGYDFSSAAAAPRNHEHAVGSVEDSVAVSGHDFSRAEEGEKKAGALGPEGSFRGQRILLARAEIARDVIPDALRAAGALVDVVDAYRNVLPDAAPALLRAALEKGIDAATFTSSSSVTHLAEAAHAAGIAFPFAGVPAISIGPITSATLREAGWEPAAEASRSDISCLIWAARQALSSRL